MNTATVLVIDDEKTIRNFIKRNLEVRNFTVHTAANGLEALAVFSKEKIDLVILDVMMPHMDGLETIRRIREHSFVPVIVLSALGEQEDKVQALNLGADDYLTKPFGVEELLARIQAVLRRTHWTDHMFDQGQITHGEVTLDHERHKVVVRGEPIDLTPTEYRLLILFMRNAGKLLTHRAILKEVWGPEYGQESEYLRVYIGRLRQKIESNPSEPTYLITEHGMGYIFNPKG